MNSEADALLTTGELAKRQDFALGDTIVSPSSRSISGPGGSIQIEPRVMQVLVLLADAAGAVVTRETLFRRCWGGVHVGDDSLNRAVAAVRRAAAEIGRGRFGVETIPRTGYRLTGAVPAPIDEPAGPQETASPSIGATRRWVLGGGAAAVALGGLGSWAVLRNRRNPRVEPLIEQGRQALSYGLPDSRQGLALFQQAVELAPDHAAAWGWLALAYRYAAENASPGDVASAVQACERAARRALELDPREGNALAALATVRPFFGDWYPAEIRLMNVLAVAPRNIAAINELVLLLQAAGLARTSHVWNERQIALDPLSPLPQFRRALKYWILGQLPRADLTIDRALQLWPRHPAVWNARMMLFAFTGRAGAALAFLEDREAQPATLTQQTRDYWRVSLRALETQAAADVAAARQLNLAAAPRNGGLAVLAIMVLTQLGDLDSSFAVASGYLLRRGALVGTIRTGPAEMPLNDTRWRRTMNLFTPATAAMRADPRFEALCEGIGLADYWRQRGVSPDYKNESA